MIVSGWARQLQGALCRSRRSKTATSEPETFLTTLPVDAKLRQRPARSGSVLVNHFTLKVELEVGWQLDMYPEGLVVVQMN